MATISSLGMTTTLPWVPSCPSGRALEGTGGLWERPLAGRVIAQPGRVRRWREGAGEGELMLNKVTLHGGASATAQPGPRQTGICE